MDSVVKLDLQNLKKIFITRDWIGVGFIIILLLIRKTENLQVIITLYWTPNVIFCCCVSEIMLFCKDVILQWCGVLGKWKLGPHLTKKRIVNWMRMMIILMCMMMRLIEIVNMIIFIAPVTSKCCDVQWPWSWPLDSLASSLTVWGCNWRPPQYYFPHHPIMVKHALRFNSI